MRKLVEKYQKWVNMIKTLALKKGTVYLSEMLVSNNDSTRGQNPENINLILVKDQILHQYTYYCVKMQKWL